MLPILKQSRRAKQRYGTKRNALKQQGMISVGTGPVTWRGIARFDQIKDQIKIQMPWL